MHYNQKKTGQWVRDIFDELDVEDKCYVMPFFLNASKFVAYNIFFLFKSIFQILELTLHSSLLILQFSSNFIVILPSLNTDIFLLYIFFYLCFVGCLLKIIQNWFVESFKRHELWRIKKHLFLKGFRKSFQNKVYFPLISWTDFRDDLPVRDWNEWMTEYLGR